MNFLKSNVARFENIEKNEQNKYLSTTNDPQIWFSFSKPLKYGWYKFTIKGEFNSLPFDKINSKLYFDFGNGLSEDNAYSFCLENGSKIVLYIKINFDCRQIRFDPHEDIAGGVEFSIDIFNVSNQNKFSVFLDQLLSKKYGLSNYIFNSVNGFNKAFRNIGKNIKANAIDHVELPKISTLSREVGSGEKVFKDMTYFLKNRSECYKEEREFPVVNSSIKPIAFYLPQFHSIKENDVNWVKGFTEWTNVTKAFSQFEGHYQPHLPADLGFYNLTDKNVIRQQVDMAKLYGIYGFCIYHYWFEGKRVLEKPLDIIFENKDLDINFMLCWANENWTKRWDGLDSQVLLKQNHNRETDRKYLESVEKYFSDSRYIRIDDKPVLMVYKPTLFPDFKETASEWRKNALEKGYKGIYLISVKGFGCENPEEFGLDALVEFPPATPAGYIELETSDKKNINVHNSEFAGKIYDYRKVANYFKNTTYDDCTVFRGVMPSWDNTARRNNDGHIFHFSSPQSYKEWLFDVSKYTAKTLPEDNRFIFINAWNEWAEGTHLEPDRYYGYSILDSTAQVLEYFPKELNNPKSFDGILGFCVHVHYYELWDEIQEYLERIDFKFHLFVSISEDVNGKDKQLKDAITKKYPYSLVKIVKNKGRDILPFLEFIEDIKESKCKYICKVHTKKSVHRQDGSIWRKELYDKLMGNSTVAELVCSYFDNFNQIGIIGPEGHLINTKNYWGYNKPLVNELSDKLDYAIEDEFHFVAGSMFWIRVEVLEALQQLMLSDDNFESEEDLVGIKDGTISHAIERIFSICCKIQNRIVIDTRVFHGHLETPFSEIARYNPNEYEYAIPIPDSFIRV